MGVDWYRRASGLLVPPALGFADNPMGRWQPCGTGCCDSTCTLYPDCVNPENAPANDATFDISGVIDDAGYECDDCDQFNDTHSVPVISQPLWAYSTAIEISCTAGAYEEYASLIACRVVCQASVPGFVCWLKGEIRVTYTTYDPFGAPEGYYHEKHEFYHENALDDQFVPSGSYDMTYIGRTCQTNAFPPFACDEDDTWPLDPYPWYCDASGASFNIAFAAT